MNTEELTQVVTAHQSAISHHDTEMADIRAVLAETARQQAVNREAIQASPTLRERPTDC
ncbi:MAG: hypothetical protein ACAF41_33480 (plasmid) [Leptolyngbya sp. BL-A-14]